METKLREKVTKKSLYYTMRKTYIRNKFNILFWIFCTVIFIVISKNGYIKTVTDDLKIDIITVNTVFAGFMYTILSNMIEFNSRDKIKLLDNVGHIDKYYSATNLGLYSFVISILIGLVSLLLVIPENRVTLTDTLMLYFMFIGVVFFLTSSYNMNRLINNIRDKV